jgi:polyisoprenoid-binding protein YceI
MQSKTYAMLSLLFISSAALAAEATHYKIDPATSKVRWEGRKKVVDSNHYGNVGIKSGDVEVKAGQITGGTIEIDMNAITDEDLTDAGYNQKLVGHLKSEDFFDVAKYPTAKFVIKEVKARKGKGGTTHEIMGDLTIKNETHPTTFPATVEMKDNQLTGKASFTINRTKWNVRYGSDKFFKSLGDKVIHDDVKFDLQLVATK